MTYNARKTKRPYLKKFGLALNWDIGYPQEKHQLVDSEKLKKSTLKVKGSSVKKTKTNKDSLSP